MPLANLAIDASRMTAHSRTGTENYSVEIIRALLSLPERPSITLYTRKGVDTAHLDGATVRPIGPRRLWTHAGLSRAMMRDRPQALFVPSHVIPLAHPRRSVVTVHDLGYLREPGAHPRSQRFMLDRTTRWNARVAARLIAISSQTKDDLVRNYQVDPTKIEVIHHGVDHERFAPQSASEIERVTAKYGIMSPYLLFVSTIQPRKNLVRLLAAYEALDTGDLPLVIAGRPGWLSGPIEERIRISPKTRQLIRVGHLSDSDLPAMYSGASAYLLPSLFEGFGMGIIEAMACGTPVVTSNTGSMAEVAGNAATLVDATSVESITSGIQETLEPGRAAELRVLGFKRASGFSWHTAAAQTLRVIEEADRAS